MDFHCDGKVNYSEFLAATISSINFYKEEKLWLAFKYFDTTDSGFITYDSVIDALKESGVVVDEDGLNNTFINLKKKGEKISFNEFKNIALGNRQENKMNDESGIRDNTISINEKYSSNLIMNDNDKSSELKEKLVTKNSIKLDHKPTKINYDD